MIIGPGIGLTNELGVTWRVPGINGLLRAVMRLSSMSVTCFAGDQTLGGVLSCSSVSLSRSTLVGRVCPIDARLRVISGRSVVGSVMLEGPGDGSVGSSVSVAFIYTKASSLIRDRRL